MTYETYIFPELFDPIDTYNDINKDIDGKGTNERFHECLGAELDENIMPYIDNLVANTLDPATCFDRYILYLESMMGYNKDLNTLYISSDAGIRRSILQKILRLYQIKGTKRALTILFSWIGMSVAITEIPNNFGFDSPRTFDDPVRRFDMRCSGCSDYNIDLTGPSLTDELLAAITSILTFNNPINAHIGIVTLNGTPIVVPGGDYNSDYSSDFYN